MFLFYRYDNCTTINLKVCIGYFFLPIDKSRDNTYCILFIANIRNFSNM